MSKNKNITNKEIRRRFDFLANYMTQVGQSLQTLTDMVVRYIDFNKHDIKFKDFLEKEMKKQEKKSKKDV